MEQFECICKYRLQCPQRCIGRYRIFILFISTDLGNLNIPVAELIPDKIINFLYSDTEFEFVHIFSCILGKCIYPGEYPLICRVQFICGRLCDRHSFQIHHDKSRCIPYFICKVSGSLHTLPVETHVISGCITRNQCQTECICTVFINDFKRIDTISE